MNEKLGSKQSVDRLFDSRSLESITGGEPVALRRLLDTLLTSSRDDRARLAQLLEHKDQQGLAELAHRIKGAARVVGSSVLVEACTRLEEACRGRGEGLALVPGYAATLDDGLETFEASILAELARLTKV